MAIVNTLSAILEARTERFRTGINRANSRVREFAKNNRTLGDVMGNVKNAILTANPVVAALGTIAVGAAAGIVALTKRAAEAADRLIKLAEGTGTSVEFLSRLSFAADQSGTSLDALSPVFRRLSRFQQEAIRGNKAVIADFERLGITVDDLRDAKPEDLFLDVADGLSRLPSASERTAIGFRLVADNIQELSPLLNQGREGIEALMGQADEFGVTVSTRFARQSAVFGDRLDLVGKLFQGIGQEIAVAVLPVLSKLLDLFLRGARRVLPLFRQALFEVRFQLTRIVGVARATGEVIAALASRDIPRIREALAGVREASQFTREDLRRLDEEGAGAVTSFADQSVEALDRTTDAAMWTQRALGPLVDRPLTQEELIARGLAVGPQAPTEQERFQAGLGPLTGETEDAIEDVEDRGSEALTRLTDLAGGFGDALVGAASRGSAAFGDFFREFFVNIARAIARALVLGIILSLTPFGGGAAFGAIFGNLLRSNLGIGGGGGNAAVGAAAAATPAPTGGGAARTPQAAPAQTGVVVRPVIEIRDSSPLVEAEHVD
ncbi:MAG: hypothetical protein R3344_03440, partial [Acidobacteriota bacterium]|nr:hypothetical protein [Acidobacteriota bacterium]